MWKTRMVAGFIVVLALLVCSKIAFTEEKAPTAKNRNPAPSPQKVNLRDPRELVVLVENASIEELQKLSFLDISVLKNAIFASKGYVFADDRPWLNVIYCGEPYYRKKKKAIQKLTGVSLQELRDFTGDDQYTPRIKKWDLRGYVFPECREGDVLDENQKKAIANIHVALFKKIETFDSIAAVDQALIVERKNMEKSESGWKVAVILGKRVPGKTMDKFEVSLRRDLHGYRRMLQLMKNVEEFDSMELLGLFAGDIMFLKNVIEAQNGKPYSGVLGWEISQIIGVTEKRPGYDPKQLPQAIQEKLKSLDDIVGKIMRSDLNDIPASLKSRPIEFSNPYDLEGC